MDQYFDLSPVKIQKKKIILPNCVNITPENISYFDFCLDSHKTQDSIKTQHEIHHWTKIHRAGRLTVWRMFDRTEQDRDRTGTGQGQDRAVQD